MSKRMVLIQTIMLLSGLTFVSCAIPKFETTNITRNNSIVYVGDFGAIPGDNIDDTQEIQNAINFASKPINGAMGRTVIFSIGVYHVSGCLYLPNRVRLSGSNGRGTIIRAINFKDTIMFLAKNEDKSMFHSRIDDLQIDANNSIGIIDVVRAEAWQENSGMKGVVITKFRNNAIRICRGYGGAAYLKLSDLEIFATREKLSKNSTGIKVEKISKVGGFIIVLDGVTITGSKQQILTNGIHIEGALFGISGFHTEYSQNGLLLSGFCNGEIKLSTGSFNRVSTSTLLVFDKDHSGDVQLSGVLGNGYELKRSVSME